MDSERQGGEDLARSAQPRRASEIASLFMVYAKNQRLREDVTKHLENNANLTERIVKLEEELEIASSQAPRNDIKKADWRAMCLELALLVDKHRRERMMEDRKAAWRMARDILEIASSQAPRNDMKGKEVINAKG